jgi:hypothetical protein
LRTRGGRLKSSFVLFMDISIREGGRMQPERIRYIITLQYVLDVMSNHLHTMYMYMYIRRGYRGGVLGVR